MASLLAWRDNKVDQEVRVPDKEIVATFRDCSGECNHFGRPLDIQMAMHLSFCMHLAFESPDYKKFSRRNWDEMLDCMEIRAERAGVDL